MHPSILTIAHPSGPSFEFIWVEGGEFNMGDDASEFGREKPAHRIKLSGFYIGKYPVIPITDRNSNNIAFTFSRGHHGTKGRWDGAT